MLPASASTLTSSPSLQPFPSRSRQRVVLIATPDTSLRERLRHSLSGLRWQVIEAPGGAEAWMAAENAAQLEALLIDPWLPDLDVDEFLRDFRRDHPNVDLMLTDGASAQECPRSPYHQELLYALRRSQDGDTAAWQAAPEMQEGIDWPTVSSLPPIASVQAMPLLSGLHVGSGRTFVRSSSEIAEGEQIRPGKPIDGNTGAETSVSFREANGRPNPGGGSGSDLGHGVGSASPRYRDVPTPERVPELIGSSPVMLEVSRRIRLVAARTTPVLIEGPTGSGKELVAEALHRLSTRSRKPFVAINCAAIPEALLEAELFGHTRGAFTGAVQGRTGRIESADGGTLFLDEIGEMPLALQSKLLRFFESGELQRIGDNETVKVDVRIVAATHQPLAEDAQKGLFRADLYYRLAVFLIRTPSLAEHMEDLPYLVAHFVDRMGKKAPVKRVDASAMAHLAAHPWPGNVRELEHVLERAEILAGDEPVITAAEIDFGLSLLN